MKLLVLLNEQAGALAGLDPMAAQDRIARGFADNGADAEVRRIDPARLVDHAREGMNTSVDAIVASGGDGAINTLAAAMASSRKALGVLPLGAQNHFARNLNIPLDVDAAVAALARGRIVEFPIGEVNGRAFLNYCSVGLPMDTPTGKFAAWWRRLPKHYLRIGARGHTFARRTPSIVVSNNADQLRALGIAPSPAPARGLINVYVADFALTVRGVWRELLGTRSFTVMALPEVHVDAWRRRLNVTLDGEVVTMRPPLVFSLRANPLRVLVPGVA